MTQTAFTPRTKSTLFQNPHKTRIMNAPEIISLLRHFAFGFADELGRDRAMVHITDLLDRMPPLIDLRPADGVDEDTACWQVRGIQEVLICARGRHDDENKIHYIRRLLEDSTWRWDGKRPV